MLRANIANVSNLPKDLASIVETFDEPCDRVKDIDKLCWTMTIGEEDSKLNFADPFDEKRPINCSKYCKTINTKRANSIVSNFVRDEIPTSVVFYGNPGVAFHDLEPLQVTFIREKIMTPIEIARMIENTTEGYNQINILYDLSQAYVDRKGGFFRDQKTVSDQMDLILRVGDRQRFDENEFGFIWNDDARKFTRRGNRWIVYSFDVPIEFELFRPTRDALLVIGTV